MVQNRQSKAVAMDKNTAFQVNKTIVQVKHIGARALTNLISFYKNFI
jgi:hypothetical protein